VGFVPLYPAEFVVIQIRQILRALEKGDKILLFPANPTRLDPLKTSKYRLKWDGKYVAWVRKCSSLKRTIEVVEHRGSGDPSVSYRSPGRAKSEAITLERGLTLDMAFHNWAGLV
jgi:T4-like virus tail tube protein gp19